MNAFLAAACGGLASALCAIPAVAAQSSHPSFAIWSGVPAGSEHWHLTEIEYSETVSPPGREAVSAQMVRNVATPTLTAYLPDDQGKPASAVIICPGGGLRFLSWEYEGTKIGQALATAGIAAFVLKYRTTPTTPDPAIYAAERQAFLEEFFRAIAGSRRPRSLAGMLPDKKTASVRRLAAADARQAVRYVRTHAAQWNIAPDRIGILGFSAGAFLATDVIWTHNQSSRIDFAALIYGGEPGGPTMPPDAPPLFMAVAQDDRWMSGIAVNLFSRWELAGKSVEFHYFNQGGHGFGMLKQNLPVDDWPELLTRWLAGQHLLDAK